MSQYRIYACEFYRKNVTTANNMFRPPDNDPVVLSCFVWAIQGEDGYTVVDCGNNAEVARRRDRISQREVDEALALAGVDCAQVKKVILTHFHFDHAGCLDLFPQAQFYAQAREMAFWTGPYVRYKVFGEVLEADDITKLCQLNMQGRLTLLDGDAEISPGIKLHLGRRAYGGHADRGSGHRPGAGRDRLGRGEDLPQFGRKHA